MNDIETAFQHAIKFIDEAGECPVSYGCLDVEDMDCPENCIGETEQRLECWQKFFLEK